MGLDRVDRMGCFTIGIRDIITLKNSLTKDGDNTILFLCLAGYSHYLERKPEAAENPQIFLVGLCGK